MTDAKNQVQFNATKTTGALPTNAQTPNSGIAPAAGGKEQEPVPVNLSGEISAESGLEEKKETVARKEAVENVQPAPSQAAKSTAQTQANQPAAATGAKQAVAKQTPAVTLPLTDDQIITGLHAHIWQSIRWLAVWCVRRLKKMHVAIREVSGKLVRS